MATKKAKPTKAEKQTAKDLGKVKHEINEILKSLKQARRPGDTAFQLDLLGVAVSKLEAVIAGLGGESEE